PRPGARRVRVSPADRPEAPGRGREAGPATRRCRPRARCHPPPGEAWPHGTARRVDAWSVAGVRARHPRAARSESRAAGGGRGALSRPRGRPARQPPRAVGARHAATLAGRDRGVDGGPTIVSGVATSMPTVRAAAPSTVSALAVLALVATALFAIRVTGVPDL